MTRSITLRTAAVAAALSAAMLGAPAQAATLLGDSITAAYYFPDLATIYGNYSVSPSATFTVGAGSEATGTVDGYNQDFDFADTSFTLTFLDGVTFTGSTFNGWTFTNNSGNFTNILSVSGPVAFGNVSSSGNQFTINWQGQTFTRGDQIVVTFGAVPEPTTWALMIGGFGMVGYAMRRRSVAVAA